MAETSLTMYEISKQIVANESPMEGILFTKKVNEVANQMRELSNYWMLLCKERSDYTVFTNVAHSTKKKIVKELIPTLRNRGEVIFIDEQDTGVWEIWIRDSETNENFAYYLFNYYNGVIECESAN